MRSTIFPTIIHLLFLRHLGEAPVNNSLRLPRPKRLVAL